MNEELKLMVNTLIDEMGRMEERINKHFDEVGVHFEKLDSRLETIHREVLNKIIRCIC